jgi:hypothetical protein
MVAIVVFAREWFYASGAFTVVARENHFLIRMDIFVVAFEICWSPEYVLFPVTWARILAGKLVLLDSPIHILCQHFLYHRADSAAYTGVSK